MKLIFVVPSIANFSTVGGLPKVIPSSKSVQSMHILSSSVGQGVVLKLLSSEDYIVEKLGSFIV